jgi:hypothetical protein
VRAELTHASTVSFDRSISGAPDDISEIFWQAVQLKDGSVVQRGAVNFPIGLAETNVTLISHNTNRAAAFASVQQGGGQNSGRSPSTGGVLGAGSATLAMTNATQLTLTRNNTAHHMDVGWFVVGFGAGSLLTPAVGGSAISADTKGAAYTSLGGPIYTEVQSGNVGTGTIILKVPAGFIFDTNATLPTVLVTRVSGSGANALNINGVASGTPIVMTIVNTTNLMFTVTSASSGGVLCSLTWQNLRVRPSAGTPLASGNMVATGTAVIQGVASNSTSFGFLAEVVGNPTKLALATAPSSTAVAGADFAQQPVIQVQDQFGNLRTADNSTAVVVTNTGTIALEGVTNVTSVGGVAAFAGLDYTVAETIKLGFTATGLIGTNSGNIVVSPAPASQLTIQAQPSPTATAGIAFVQQPVLRVEDAFGNFRSTDNSTVVIAAIDQGSDDLAGTTNSTAIGGLVSFGNLTYLTAETITIDFSSGSLAPDTSASIVVNPAGQTITFSPLPNRTYGEADFTLSASASSGLPVAFSIVSGPAAVSGSLLSIGGAGVITVRASQAGDATFAAATPVDQSFTVLKTNSILVVSTSANPSPTASNVTFTATVSAISPGGGTPAGTVRFLVDGAPLGSPASLAGGVASITTALITHGTHTLAAEYAGDDNFFGSTNSLSPIQIINTLPVANLATYTRSASLVFKIRIYHVLTNSTSDADGDARTLLSVSSGTNGATITTNATYIFYSPSSSNPSSNTTDHLSYVITDGFTGGTATNQIRLNVEDPNIGSQSANMTGIAVVGITIQVTFVGIPGYTYRVQRTVTPNGVNTVWGDLGTATASALGAGVFVDANPPAGQAYYRSVWP